MKTRSVTISVLCFVLATLSVNAQSGNEFKTTNLLPYLLDSVVFYGSQSFSKIRGEAKSGNNYVSLLTVEGAEKTYIREKTYNLEWVADYGTFKSFEAAKSKLDELKQQFIGIAPNAQFMEITPKFAEYPDYVLKVTCRTIAFGFTTPSTVFYPTKRPVSSWSSLYPANKASTASSITYP